MRCDICGRYRHSTDIIEMENHDYEAGHYETWYECKFCMPQADRVFYFREP